MTELHEAVELTELLLRGKYQEVLKNKIVEWIFGPENKLSLDQKLTQVLVDNVERYMTASDESTRQFK